MIHYNCETKSFLINGKNYSYAVYINRAGFLQHIYYGRKIEENDLAYLVKTHGAAAEPAPEDLNMDLATDVMPSECGSFGRGDFRPATVIVKQTKRLL